MKKLLMTALFALSLSPAFAQDMEQFTDGDLSGLLTDEQLVLALSKNLPNSNPDHMSVTMKQAFDVPEEGVDVYFVRILENNPDAKEKRAIDVFLINHLGKWALADVQIANNAENMFKQ